MTPGRLSRLPTKRQSALSARSPGVSYCRIVVVVVAGIVQGYCFSRIHKVAEIVCPGEACKRGLEAWTEQRSRARVMTIIYEIVP